MGLTAGLLRFAAGLPHVFVAETPGGAAARLAVEETLGRRGSPLAASPADADILIITGPVGPRLAPFVDRLWRQVPYPRVRVHVRDATAAETAVDHACGLLAEGGEPPGTAQDSLSACGGDPARGGRYDEHQDEHDQPGGAGEGQDHHGDMVMPGGLPMADRGPDRDGLMLDQLHVPLGPLLPGWPAGLVLHTMLQGDVVQRARVEVLLERERPDAFWNEPWRRAAAGELITAGECARRRVVAHLDSLDRFLAVAGWADAALRAQGVRDAVRAGASAEQVGPPIRRLIRRLRGSRTLRWLTGELGILSEEAAVAAGVTGPARNATDSGGDVCARWQVWLSDVERSFPGIDDTASPTVHGEGPRGRLGDREASAALLEVLPGLVEGTELAGARLIVASLDPDIAELAHHVVAESADG